MDVFSRREFLERSAILSAAAAALGTGSAALAQTKPVAARAQGATLRVSLGRVRARGMREAIEYVQGGKSGKVDLAIGLCYKRRPSIGDAGLKTGEQKPPATMDYDLWCGPAPLKLPRRNTSNGTVHYDWHWIWDYGN